MTADLALAVSGLAAPAVRGGRGGLEPGRLDNIYIASRRRRGGRGERQRLEHPGKLVGVGIHAGVRRDLLRALEGLRERLALLSGPLIAFGGLVAMTAIALLPGLALLALCALVMGLGIGIYNVHLVARAMDSAAPGEQRSTAAALTSVRSIGTAFGAAIAGVVASMAGLGDATEPEAVGRAVTAVYLFCWVPFGLAAVFMLRFVRVALPSRGRVAATAD